MELFRIRHECEDCGCSVLVVEDKPTDASWVTCKDCGNIYGRFKSVKVDTALRGMPAVIAEVQSKLVK